MYVRKILFALNSFLVEQKIAQSKTTRSWSTRRFLFFFSTKILCKYASYKYASGIGMFSETGPFTSTTNKHSKTLWRIQFRNTITYQRNYLEVS